MMMGDASSIRENFIPCGRFNLFINMDWILVQSAKVEGKIKINTGTGIV